MTNKRSTKRALIASVISLLLCFTMLMGTTYAWFTDSVESNSNIIKTGNLDVEMYWANGADDPASTTWTDASTGAIFNYDKWEPGYADAKHLKIANEGTLALKYQMRIVANGTVSKLADVIDVYYFDTATQLTRETVEDGTYLGTLTDILGTENNISKRIMGTLEANTSKEVTLVLKMQESAGNEYQNLSIGTDFNVELIATQYTSESDSFNNQYDSDVPSPEKPAALVRPLTELNVPVVGLDSENVELDVAFQFEPTEDYDAAQKSIYRYYHADFVVSADSDVAANSMALAGYYKLFCDNKTDGKWVALRSDDVIKKGQEIRLVEAMGQGSITVNYEDLCLFGNDGTGFQCGAVDLDGSNEGTTITVELRLYETTKPYDATSGTANEETGEFITVGKFTYTFDDPNIEYLADGSRVRYGENGEVTLEGVDRVNVTNGTYYVPDGITKLNSELFTQNSNIKTVVISDTVTDFGVTGTTENGASGGAFKGSAVEEVVLPEGMTKIPDAAFNQAKNLHKVNIPSTVTEIGKSAFRLTALTTLTVPANVETIGVAAFREMLNLTTVTIEGNAYIDKFAFRDSAALKNIYLNGDNVTIYGEGQVFTLTDHNNDGPDMTFFVQNETVADSLRTNMSYNNKVENEDYFIVLPTETVVSIETTAGEKISLNVTMSEQAHESLVTHGEMNQHASTYANYIGAITVYTKADIKAAYELWQAGIFVHNGTNDVSPVITFGADINFGGEDFCGFGKEFVIDGQGHTLSNINFVMPEGSAKAGLIPYSGNTTIKNLTIKDATVTGAQAGIFGGNVENAQVENCALAGNIVINWVPYTATYNETANGVGAVWGVTSGADATKNTIDVDTTNANITINKEGISYPDGFATESNEIVGVVYNGSSYSIKVDDVTYAVVSVSDATALQAALDNATSATIIQFAADITGDVTVTQKADVDLVINGCDNKFTGIMTVFGNGRQSGAETLTIKNINFVAANGAASCIVSPDRTTTNLYSYSHNVTVDNCTFTDPDGTVDCAAIRHEDGGDKNWVVKNCTVDGTMHSLFQVNNVVGKLTVDNCKVNSKNGANLNSCTNVEITNCNFDVKGYAVRFGVSSGGNLGEDKMFVIKNSTLKSACDDGDAVILFRASAVDANLTLTNTTLDGTTEISGNTDATTITRN